MINQYTKKNEFFLIFDNPRQSHNVFEISHIANLICQKYFNKSKSLLVWVNQKNFLKLSSYENIRLQSISSKVKMLKIIFIDEETQRHCYYSNLDQSVHKRLYHEQINQRKFATVVTPSMKQCPQQNYSTPSFAESQLTQRLNYFKRQVTDTDFQQILSFVREKFGVQARIKYTKYKEPTSQGSKQPERNQFIEHKQGFLKMLTKPLSKIYIDSKSVSVLSKKSVQQEQCGIMEQIHKEQKKGKNIASSVESKTVQDTSFQVIVQSKKMKILKKYGLPENESKNVKKAMKRSFMQQKNESNLHNIFDLFLAALLLLALGIAMICLDRDLKKEIWQFLI